MASKKQRAEHGISQGMGEARWRIVLVGTYKGEQLTKWRGWYSIFSSKKQQGLRNSPFYEYLCSIAVTNQQFTFFKNVSEFKLIHEAA